LDSESAYVVPSDYDSYRVLGLPLTDVKEKTTKIDGKCYKYRVEDATCEIPSS